LIIRKANKPDLESIIKGCKDGKSSAQKYLFEDFYGFAMKICLRYGSDRIQAEEMVNDSFLKVFKNIDSYNENHSFHAWFKTITVRTCIDYYRKYSSKVSFVDVEDTPFIEDKTGDALDQLSAEEILELVQKLPPSYRTAFSLFVIDGYSHAEIAEMLGVNEGTSRSNLAKARLKLQEWIRLYLSDKVMRY
jgi:RNA polymerase sigma-70 factor (ECF subfamily)